MRRDLDTSLLRTFLTVADVGGMTAAAKVLNLTQAAISQQIKRLEEHYDEALFHRERRKLVLTAAGERLLVGARRIVGLNDEIFGLMTAPEHEGIVRIGVPHDIVGSFMPPIMQRFHEKWPRIEISLASGNTFQLLEKMAEGGLDLTLTTEHEAAHGDAFLMRDQLVWIGAPGGRAHLNPTIPVALSGENCAFRPPIVRVMSEVSQDWRLAYAVQDQTAMLAMVEADLAVSVSLTSVVPSSLRVIDSGLPPLPQSNINLRRPAHCESPITAELAAHVQRHFRRISQRRVPLKPVALAG